MKTSRVFHAGLSTAAVALVLQGCAASGSPNWDSQFGNATRQITAQQLIDPRAPQRNGDTQPKADGRTAREAHDRYVETYTAPPPQINMILVAPGGGR